MVADEMGPEGRTYLLSLIRDRLAAPASTSAGLPAASAA